MGLVDVFMDEYKYWAETNEERRRRVRRLKFYRQQLHDYMAERFRRNNHPKYHKYCEEWISQTTIEQLRYFEQEKRRIDCGVVLR